ncbi:hypothetical protein [uncultured Chitinophaga sp.]|uniref:hypothetical protein n=1 Tax=uncultured Chitinophaga sp. TaxID=339340 RepID=UPI0026213EE9|nr:hypothetical protein [uncultured Chitinophaga sp.]
MPYTAPDMFAKFSITDPMTRIVKSPVTAAIDRFTNKAKLHRWLLVYSFTLSHLVSFAQSENINQITLKNFTPPSPEVAALGRYGEIPVSLSTGIPEINIPIYEIKSRKLSLPISLSYHASGIKVEDIATPAGLGWVINCGGSISRTVAGIADERDRGLLKITNPNDVYKSKSLLQGKVYDGDDLFYLTSLATGAFDSQSDNYNINIPGLAGKFVYDINKQMHITPVDRQLKINRNADNTFTVIDDAGVRYFFNETEITENLQASNDITSWHLTMMISADLTDTITFKYKAAETYEDFFDSYSFYINVLGMSGAQLCELEIPNFNWSTQMTVYKYHRKLIDTIKFANGYVKFEYANDRQDPIKERLSGIKVYNEAGLIKAMQLVHSYFTTGKSLPAGKEKYDKRLRLDKVNFNDKTSAVVSSYTFEYETALPPYRTYNGGSERKSTAMDFWGYCNGLEGATLLPKNYSKYIDGFLLSFYPVANTSVREAYELWAVDRYTSPSSAQACMLKKIIYPTGAYSIFQYESNRTTYTTDRSLLQGGLRIARIINIDTIANKTLVKSYKYDEGIAISRLYPDDFTYTVPCKWRHPTFSSFCTGGSFYIFANPITPFNYFGGSSVFYTKVTEYDGFPGDNNGKTEYRYEYEQDSVFGYDLIKYWNFSTDKSWARGQLLNKKIYKRDNADYILQKEIKHSYTSLGRKSVRIGQICEQTINVYGIPLATYLTDQWVLDKVMLNYFDYADISLSFGSKMLTKTEEIDYQNDTIIRKQEIFYDGPNHLYPTKIVNTASKTGETTTEIRKYPQNKSSILNLTTTASAAIDGMVNSNILSVPIEVDLLRNTDLTYRKRTDFRNWNNSNRFYEDIIYQQVGGGALEPRIKYISYDDKGNPTSLQYVNGRPVSYIWDYNASLVAASVTNAASNEIAYTSFETVQGGNWVINPAAITIGGYTGAKAYNLAVGNITKASLNINKEYIVSYWTKSGTAQVNGIAGQAVSTRNGWTLYEHYIANPNTITVSGNALLDELRLFPKDAQMNSYTHLPLIGTLSMATANNLPIFYEYDNYGRLNRLLDADRKIIKQLEYKYNAVNNNSTTANWAATGNNRCVTGLEGRATGISEREVRDINTTSPTYNQTVWSPTANICPIYPAWIETGQQRCQKDSRGRNNGYVEKEYIDKNQYSYTYNEKSWMVATFSMSDCPPPCDQEGQKKINGVCEMGNRIYTLRTETVLVDGQKICYGVYHYEWSDGSVSDTYEERLNGECPAES